MTTFVEEFQQLQKILCVCPCCNEIVRASDLHFKVKGKITKTWLDLYEDRVSLMERKEEKFQEREAEVREKSRERGREDAKKITNKTILPIFKEMKSDLSDVIPLLHPVDFVIFNGMCQKEKISNILFLSKKTQFEQLQKTRKQVQSAIEQKRYKWQVNRIENDGKINFEQS